MHTKDILSVVAQEHGKKRHWKISVSGETFEINYAVALTFTLTQPNRGVQKDKKKQSIK
jgi:hypothetical protein